MKLWEICDISADTAKEIRSKNHFCSLLTYAIMARGIDDSEAAASFLYDMEVLDTCDIPGTDIGADMIKRAVESGEKIGVFGDYDADGICAACLLVKTLKNMGADVVYKIPNRFNGGYGISIDAVKQLRDDGVSLLVSVDNGIGAYEEIAYAKAIGMDVVLTDHHLPKGSLPPADVIINPQVAGTDSTKMLCGAGVAMFLSNRLEGVSFDETLKRYSQEAAIATVADVMEINGVNRKIVASGLSGMKKDPTTGISALIEASNIKVDSLSASSLAFGIAPRLNAVGRLGDGTVALELLLSCDKDEAKNLASILNETNDERRAIEEQVVTDAVNILVKNPELISRPVLVLWGEDWNEGVLGIAAARLLEMFGKPTVMLRVHGETAKGSCRSGSDFDMFSSLSSCSESLLKFGGHRQAGGLSIMKKDIQKFARDMCEYADSQGLAAEMGKISVCAEIKISELTARAVDELSLLEPCGYGNPRPCFLIKNMSVTQVIPLSDGKFRKLKVECDGEAMWLLDFSRYGSMSWIGEKTVFDGVVTPRINEYNGVRSVSAILTDAHSSDFDEEKILRDVSVGISLFSSEKIVRIESGDIPVREDLISVYRYVQKENIVRYDPVGLSVKLWGGVRASSMAIAIHMMVDGGLFSYVCEKGKFCVKIIKDAQHTDLTKSKVLSRIEEV